MKKKVIIITASQDGTELEGAMFWYAIYNRLKEEFYVDIVCNTKEQYLFFKKKRISAYYYPSLIKRYQVDHIARELKNIEEKYNCSVEQILVGDYIYNHSVPRKKAFIDMIKIFKFWEVFIEKNKPDFIIGCIHRFKNLIPYHICKTKKTKYLIFSSSVVQNTFTLTENKRGGLTLLDKYWKNNKNKKLTKEEKIIVNRYIEGYLKQDKESFEKTYGPKLNLRKIKYSLNRIYVSLFIEKGETPYLKPSRGIKTYFLRMIRSRLSKIYFSKPKKGEKFLFFPLHVEWDTPIPIWNPQFIHQERLIEIISRNLPTGYKLYAKTHPGDIGGNELSQLKAINKLPNVRLLNPIEDRRELIKKASAILVIGGTIGWESLLHKKPTIVLGSTYYNKCELVHNIEDLGDLHKVIKDVLKQKDFDNVKLMGFVNAYLKTIYQGRLYSNALFYANISNREDILNKKNIELVANSFIKAMTKDFK